MKEFTQQDWLDEMNANCEEYLPYEEQFDPEGFQPLDELDIDSEDIPF